MLDRLELDPEVLGDRASARQDRDVFEHRLAAIAEARRLDRGGLQRAAQLVDHEGRERFAFDVFRDDQQRTAEARHLLEHRQEILHRADLLLVDQDDRVFEHHFHALRIGHEVGGQVAAVELHALDHVERRVECPRFFDGGPKAPSRPTFSIALGDDLADLSRRRPRRSCRRCGRRPSYSRLTALGEALARAATMVSSGLVDATALERDRSPSAGGERLRALLEDHASANTVALVVPSPATSRSSWRRLPSPSGRPYSRKGSLSSISFATVTPSTLTIGAPPSSQ